MLKDPFDTSDVVDLAEEDARLRGLMAMLALPELRMVDGRHRRRLVEIEVSPNHWAAVDAVSIDADSMTFSHGANGTRAEYRFMRVERVPRWRVDANVERFPPGEEYEHDTTPHARAECELHHEDVYGARP